MRHGRFMSTGLLVDVIWLKEITDSANSSLKYDINMVARKGRKRILLKGSRIKGVQLEVQILKYITVFYYSNYGACSNVVG
jgi:hypothetical protein